MSSDHPKRYVTEMDRTIETNTCTLPPALKLVVNGCTMTVCATTLTDLLRETGYGDTKVATARNGDFVPERLRVSTTLVDGDRIEILSPRQGG